MKKSAFMTRRKVIIYIVLTILTLGIAAGFTNPFVTDGVIHSSAFGETIVMEKEPPTVGKPSDYDLLSNLEFAAYRLHHASFFRGETDGKVEADIGFTSYVQNLRNTRISTGDGIVFAETVSSSSLKSLAEQKYADNGIIIYRPSVSVKNGVPVFSDSAYQMTYDDFAKSYGSIPNQLSKYIITPETIISVKDEYATEQTQTSAEAPRDGDESENGDFAFYVPENLVQGENGDYKFTLTLDPDASSRYYRNEVRTLGGADQNPKFYSVYVTINIDGDWNPISVTTRENYDIAIPVLGAMNCQGTNVETFYQINDENGEVPNRDFFRPYVDAAKNDPNYVPPAPPVVKPSSPADYLASAFADYISGKRNLELTANVKTDYVSAYDAVVSVNLGTTEIQAMLGDLYVKYAGDKVNIKLNGINGYLDTADLTDALKNPDVAALMGDKADLLKTLDFTAMLGGDILGTVFENCEMTSDNGVTRIQMTFDVDLAQIDKSLGKAAVDASIYINDADMSLQSITGEVTVKNVKLKINARPLASSPDFPSVDGAVDLKPLIDFVPDIAATATRKTFGIKGDISVNDIALGVDAYVDITDGTAAEATVTVNGLPVAIRYLGDEFYASIGDITVKGKADQIPELIEALKPIVGNSLDIKGTLEKLKAMLPATLNSYVSMVKNISATDTTLAAELNVLTVPLSLSLTRADGALSGAEFSAKIDLLGFKLDAALDLDLTYPTRRTISAPAGEYITVSELATLVSSVTPYLQADADYSVSFNGTVTGKGSPLTIGGKAEIDKLVDENGNVTGVNAKGTVSALGIGADFAYVGGTAYVSVGAFKFRAGGDDVAALSPALSRILDMFGISLDGVSLDPAAMLGMIKGVSAKDGALVVTLNALGTTVTASVDPQSGLITLVGDGIDLTLNVSVEKDINVSAPADGEAYIALGTLAPTLEAIADVLQTKGVTASLELYLDGKTHRAALEASFADDNLKLTLNIPELPLYVTVIGKRAYIAVNDIRVTGTTDDIPALISALDGVIPQSASDIITKLLGILNNGMGDTSAMLETALDAVKSISINNGILDANIAAGGTEVRLNIATDLSSVTVIPVVDGADMTISVTGITPAALDITPPAGDFAEASMIAAAAKLIMPLALAKAFALNVDAELFGTRISGDVYMAFGKTLADVSVKAELVAGDLPVNLYVTDGMIYLSIANTVSVKEALSFAALDNLLAVIDGIKPGVKQTVTHIIEVIKATTLKDILGITRLAPATDGFVAELDLGRMTEAGDKVSLTAHTDGEKLTAIDVDCVLFGKAFGMSFDAVVTDGVLSALNSTDAEESNTSINIGIAATEVAPVTVSGEYMALGDLTAFVSPALALADRIKTAGYAELDLGMFIGIDNNKQTYAEGKAKLWFAPFAAEITLTLFKTENPETKANETNITVKYVNDTVYVECEQMLLKLDTATDIETLYGVISHYIPENNYLNKEIKKLLGLDDGASIFSSLSQLVERFEQIAACNGDAEKIVGLLFSPMSGLSNDSALKTVADMLGLMYNADGNVAIAANVMGMTLNVVPALANGTIERATVSTNIGLGKSSVYVRLGINGYTLLSESDMPEAMTAPENETDFVSVMAFVSAIDNAVNTFTARDEDGNITVELNTFDFDYYIYRVLTAENEKGEIVNVKDSAGRDTPMTDAAGNKLIDKHIVVSNRDANTSVLQAKFIRREIKDESDNVISVKYDFNLAAHIKLDIRTSSDGSKEKLASKTGYPITLDLYMINDGVSAATAFVDYKESSATGGNGERVYIDYNSLMQIVAAALDIIDVNDKTMTELLGDYRLDIDTTVFDSMSIAGLNDIKVQIDNVAKAVEHGKAAIGEIKAAWNAVIGAGSVDGLKAKLEDIGAMMENAKASLDLAVAALGIKKSHAPEQKEMTEINGELFKNIATGVAFSHADGALSANIQNSLTTGASGTAAVSATSVNDRITAVEVDGLDVNTKLLQTFKASFTSGNALDIALPADYQSDSMNFGNVKHLLFDIMNTANMLEFEIGGGSNDKINLDVLGVIKMDIKYSAKVKIVDQGVGANPRYKTAADIQLDLPGYFVGLGKASVFGLPKCTTRVFFYDDVIYMHGVNSWKGNAGWTNSQHTYTVNYTDELFTVAEFFDMLDTEKHPDGIDRLFKEFVFKLLPLRDSFAGFSIHNEIINAIKNPPAASENLHTLAQIFKGYEYDNGLHNLTIGLKELALNGSLRDLKVNFTGANDGDDNILDNYVSTAYIETAFGTDGTTIATLKLDASLVNTEIYTQYYTDNTFTVPSPANAQTDYARAELKSKGLNKTNIDGKQYALDGTDGIINTLLAVVTKDAKDNITDVQNRAGGTNWSRPWKAA